MVSILGFDPSPACLSSPLARYLLTLAYDGRYFLGWQRQPSDAVERAQSNIRRHARSVQATVEDAVFRFCRQRTSLHAAGRTDRGVHALAQFAHLDLDLSRFDSDNRSHEELLRDALNFHLKPLPVVVKNVQEVSPALHARFSATSRTYLYRIVVSRTRPVFREGGVWYRKTNARTQQRWGDNGEEGLMRLRRSVQDFLGEHDFQAFRSNACQARSSVKRMYKAEAHFEGDEIRLVFQASGFLYRQVRLMTGTLLAVAEQRLPENSVRRLLKGEQIASSPSRPFRFAAPAHGLYFSGATYDELPCASPSSFPPSLAPLARGVLARVLS